MNGFRASKKYLWPVNFPNSPTIDKCGEKLILDAVCNTKPYMYPTTATGMLKGLKPVMKPVKMCCCAKRQKKLQIKTLLNHAFNVALTLHQLLIPCKLCANNFPILYVLQTH